MRHPVVCISNRGWSFFLGGILLMATMPARAQLTPPPPAPLTGYTAIVTNFFELDKQMKYKEAADCLLNSNPAEIDNATMHEQLFTALDGLRQKFGDFKKFATIVDKHMGPDISYVYGLALYDKGAARFEFIFARDDTGWQLLSCSYSLNITDELRALAGVPTQPVSAGAK